MSERLLSGGSQGTSIKLIASRLKQKGIKDEEIEECWNCFTQFPINEKNKLTAGDMRNYLQRLNNSQISLEFAEKGLGQLVGLKHPVLQMAASRRRSLQQLAHSGPCGIQAA